MRENKGKIYLRPAGPKNDNLIIFFFSLYLCIYVCPIVLKITGQFFMRSIGDICYNTCYFLSW